jgi:NIPSNAP protein
MAMATQLRMYTINRGKMDEFVRAWKAGVSPLRQRLGFRIDGAWVIPERNQFVWLLSYDGIDWDARDAAYYASPERKALDPDPAQFIAFAQQWFLTEVLPRR